MSEDEARLRRVIEHAPIILWAVDARGVITLSEGRSLASLGLQPGEAVGRSAFEMYADFPQIQEHLRRGLAGEEFSENVDVGPLNFETRYCPVRDEQGQVVGLLGISIDVSSRRRAELERERLQQQLLQSQKLEGLGLLAGGIAHDFNNLLTAILGSTSAALMSLAPEHPARGDLANVARTAKRAAHLTRQLLAYSGKGHFEIKRVDVSRHVRELATLLETSIPKLVQLRLELGDRLPPIEADVAQLQQVIMNLVINAAEAIGDARGTVSISTGSLRIDDAYAGTSWAHLPAASGDYVYLEVRDTGCGMDEATQAKIFDPFFSTKFTGRGLGLAAVLGIVRSHKGGLKVHSALGSGTTFKVLFPASDGVATSSQMSLAETRVFHGHVLVIDDDPGVRSAVKSMLELLGLSVDLAEHGRQGLERASNPTRPYSLILLDMTMPEMGGEETFKALRALVPGARVILMSGYDEVEATRRFTTKGLAGFLQKPFAVPELCARLVEVLEQGQTG